MCNVYTFLNNCSRFTLYSEYTLYSVWHMNVWYFWSCKQYHENVAAWPMRAKEKNGKQFRTPMNNALKWRWWIAKFMQKCVRFQRPKTLLICDDVQSATWKSHSQPAYPVQSARNWFCSCHRPTKRFNSLPLLCLLSKACIFQRAMRTAMLEWNFFNGFHL